MIDNKKAQMVIPIFWPFRFGDGKGVSNKTNHILMGVSVALVGLVLFLLSLLIWSLFYDGINNIPTTILNNLFIFNSDKFTIYYLGRLLLILGISPFVGGIIGYITYKFQLEQTN